MGLIFSTLVACKFLISLLTSLYLRVIKSPVFWQFASSSFRFALVSAVSVSIEGSNAKSALIDRNQQH